MLDAATSAFVEKMAAENIPPLHELSVEEARSFGAALVERYGPGPAMERVENRVVRSDDDAVFAVRVLVPNSAPGAVIVYYHGGGWVIGDIDEFDTLGRKLAKRTGCAVVLVNYGLAPEHPFPAAVDDAYAALRWTDENMSRIAGGAVPLIVAGDSAGGNLAAVTTQRARDDGGPAIHVQLLVYPVTDANFDTESYRDPENQLLLSRDAMIWFWAHYLPDPERRKQPLASPIRARNLAGLPPAIVITAEHDPLRDEAEAYADLLRGAGVRVDAHRFDGQMHGFFSLVNVLPESEKALDYASDLIRQHLQ